VDADSFQLARARTDFHIRNLSSFLTNQLQWLERAQNEEDEWFRAKFADVRQAVIDVYGDDAWTDADVEIFNERFGGDNPDSPDEVFSAFDETYPTTVLYAFVMLVTMVFESELLTWCDLLSAQERLPSFDSRAEGPTIDKFSSYLHDTVGVTSISNAQWARLRDLMLVRDVIAHEGGRIRKQRRRNLSRLVRLEPNLSIHKSVNGQATLRLSKEYCEAIVALVRSFFEVLLDATAVSDKL
jgi:hypothetical protein